MSASPDTRKAEPWYQTRELHTHVIPRCLLDRRKCFAKKDRLGTAGDWARFDCIRRYVVSRLPILLLKTAL